MAESLPVVATDVGGAVERVVDGFAGRLVLAGDPAVLAEALAHDPALPARCGAAGQARIAARFDERRMVQDYRRLLLPLAAEGQSDSTRPCPIAETIF
jgi:glycosyltransferase involved in cell wall biosynthesis